MYLLGPRELVFLAEDGGSPDTEAPSQKRNRRMDNVHKFRNAFLYHRQELLPDVRSPGISRAM
jgi:hypothetical protein